MARGAVEISSGGRCFSFKRITVAICCLNLVVALFLLRSLYISLRFDSTSGSDYNSFSGEKAAHFCSLLKYRSAFLISARFCGFVGLF